MNIQVLLVRTRKASKEAKEQGLLNTAEAFEEIAESLLQLMNLHVQSMEDKRANSLSESLHLH